MSLITSIFRVARQCLQHINNFNVFLTKSIQLLKCPQCPEVFKNVLVGTLNLKGHY